MIDYDVVNSMIGKRWVYIDNDCWSVFVEASKKIFNREVMPVEIPKVSNLKKNTELFSQYFECDRWPIVENPIGGDAILLKSPKGLIIHIGIYIEKDSVLHCYGSKTIEGQTLYEPVKNILPRYHGVEFRRCK